jgi:hypothetical protein
MSQHTRLARKQTALAAISRRISWLRLMAFLGGIALTWLVAASAGSLAGGMTLLLASVLFIALVIAHRRLDRQERRLRLLGEYVRQQAARRALAWDGIPLPAASLDPRPPHDIDLDLTGPRSLHHLLDSAISHQGSARLAAWLTADTPDPAKIAARQAIVAELARLPGFRQHLTLIFRQISQAPLDAEKLLAWLQTPCDQSRLQRLLPFVTPLVLINAALFALSVTANWPPVWALTSALYGLLYVANRGPIGEFLAAIVRLDDELMPFQAVLRFLERYPYAENSPLLWLCACFRAMPSPTQRLRQLKWVTAMAGVRMNPVLGLLINLVFPWDFWAAWLAARQRVQMERRLPAWLDTLHELEALISLGNFAALNPGYVFPGIVMDGLDRLDQRPASVEQRTPFAVETNQAGLDRLDQRQEAVFSVRSLGHPLLPPVQKVCNDFALTALGEVALITGSNMAGKSTFIRTVGVNLCLAYAGGPVCATAWHSLPFRLYTCIRISDSLGDGFSYFYAEVKRLKGLLEALNDAGFPLLYLIDEIFRGTNNRERLVGSRAYVQALAGAPGAGLIATHDLELAGLSETNAAIRNYHFRDDVQANQLIFDYRIRPGPSPTTNALKIMAQEGLPIGKTVL